MGFWGMVAIGAVGTFIVKQISNAQEAAEEEKRKKAKEERRKKTPCNFTDGISEEQFKMIVKQACKRIKRLSDLSINGPVVCGTVRTNSGISEWDFKVDFNDYGHITGKYWLLSNNEDSSIPITVAEEISSKIQSYPKEFGDYIKSNTYEDANVWRNINVEETRQQSELFKNSKWNRIKKKIQVFSLLLLFCFLLSVTVFVFYKYKEKQKYIEVGISSFEVIGEDYKQIMKELEDVGFTNIYVNPEYDLEYEDIENEDKIIRIRIHGDNEFDDSSQYPYDTPVEIIFHALKRIDVPISAKTARKMDFTELETMLRDMGFVNVSTQAKYDLITGWITKDGTVNEISINGETEFPESSSYRPDAEIIIIYHTFKENKD